MLSPRPPPPPRSEANWECIMNLPTPIDGLMDLSKGEREETRVPQRLRRQIWRLADLIRKVGSVHGSDVLNIFGSGKQMDYLVPFVTNLYPNGGSTSHLPEYTTFPGLMPQGRVKGQVGADRPEGSLSPNPVGTPFGRA